MDPEQERKDAESAMTDFITRMNQQVASEPFPDRSNRGRVESSWSVSPMTPVTLAHPEGIKGGVPDQLVHDEGTPTTYGAFYGRYVDEDGHTFLQGGTVVSGSGSFTFADRKVIDATGGPEEGDGDILYANVTVNGYVVDGVLLGGLTATAAVYATGASIPDNTLPTAASSSSKKVYVEIGRYTATDFLPSGTGHINITFCPGSYTVTRF